LEPQISTKRKQRFFKYLEPVVESGVLSGIRIHLGVGSFTVRKYSKTKPRRWVLRVGDAVIPPFHRGPWAVPVVPYADLIDEETPGRRELAAAELAYANGDLESSCTTFEHLRTTLPKIATWAAIREADCLLEQNMPALARELLTLVATQGDSRATQLLARVRLAEITGTVMRGKFFEALYVLTAKDRSQLGTIADEIDFREARVHLFRGDAVTALQHLEDMLAKRPQSPFFLERSMIKGLRWRTLSTTVREKQWLVAAKTYLRIPPMPRKNSHWVDIHMLGARALSEVGLPQRSIQVYLHLLRLGGTEIDELVTLVGLAKSYAEAGDNYRAELTVNYLKENYPNWRKDRDLLRLKGQLLLARGDIKNATRIAGELTAKPEITTADDARLTIASALKGLKSEGLQSARILLSSALRAGHDLTRDVADDLAMAASDCEHLERSANPVEIATSVQLLWAASCLSRVGRLDEALVYLQAAQAYRAEDLSDPELWPIIQLVQESVQWWSRFKDRLAPDEDTSDPAGDESDVFGDGEAAS
jgi:tetratricopeptide (TPR) repeat protein